MKILCVILLISLLGTVAAEDYVNFRGVHAKDLSKTNFSEMRRITANDDAWTINSGVQIHTPSQIAFAKDDPLDGKPIGQSVAPFIRVGSRMGYNRTAMYLFGNGGI